MDEFAELYFTGANADAYQKFRRTVRILSLLGALFTLLSAVLAFFDVPLAAILTLCILGFLLDGAANVVLLFKKRTFGTLFEMQRAQNLLGGAGEERERSERLGEAYLLSHPVHRLPSEAIGALFKSLGFLVLCIAAILIGAEVVEKTWLLAAAIAGAILLAVPSFWLTARESKERAAFYARAGRDIDVVKREKLGISEKKIFAEAESARGFSSLPASVELFLKEDVERKEFNKITTKSSIAAFSVGLFLGVSLLLPILLAGVWEKLGSTLVWTIAGTILALAIGALLAFVLPLEARKKEIYRRNYEKLGESEADSIRRYLEDAWIRSQRAGNIMFFSFMMGAIVLGTVLGLTGHFIGEAGLVESLGTWIMCCLIPAAIVSFIIWTVMYALYRRKARPLEMRLKYLREEEV